MDMITTKKNDVTADEQNLTQSREIAQAVAELNPSQLFHWTIKKLWEIPEGSDFRRILKDLQLRVGHVFVSNHDHLQSTGKPSNEKVPDHELFVMYQLTREILDDSLPKLDQQEAEHIRKWFSQLEELILVQNLPMIWSWSDRKSLDFPYYGLMIDLDMAMADNPSEDAKRLWKDMFHLVGVLGRMKYASYSFKQFINQCSREYGELF
jgi:hypothetical protein